MDTGAHSRECTVLVVLGAIMTPRPDGALLLLPTISSHFLTSGMWLQFKLLNAPVHCFLFSCSKVQKHLQKRAEWQASRDGTPEVPVTLDQLNQVCSGACRW